MHRDPRRVPALGSLVAGLILGLAFGAVQPVASEDFDHVHLIAPDTMAAAQWYNDLFGGKLGKSGPFDAVFYGNDILKVREGEPTSGSGGTSVDHIGWHTTEYDPWLERLRAGGVKFVVEPRELEDGHRIAFIEGPDGTKIEVVELLEGGAP